MQAAVAIISVSRSIYFSLLFLVMLYFRNTIILILMSKISEHIKQICDMYG